MGPIGRITWLTIAILSLPGAAIYTARIPGIWYQLRYDINGCSHQVFHCIVIFAALAHMLAWIAKCFRLYSLAGSVLYLKTGVQNYT